MIPEPPEKSVSRFYLPLSAAMMLLSAFLMFSIEPMAGKMILPLLGGAPQVWNTAMVFFQAMLLAGYGYAHLSSRFLPPRRQAAFQVLLMAAGLLFLPIALPDALGPPDNDHHPIWWQLRLMTVMAGIPFFLLATTAPLVQRWFAASGHPSAYNPYFLYVASNVGSLAGLLAYPVLIEPMLTVSLQLHIWAYGFGTLFILNGLAALLIKSGGTVEIGESTVRTATPMKLRLQWLALAFLPSSLMLGVTTYITTDVAAIPLLWVMPLALYVLTFIIAFSRRPVLSLKVTTIAQTVIFLAVMVLLILHTFLTGYMMIAAHLLLFFFSALLCHSQLAALRPEPRKLTEFYLIMAAGGVLGGMFNAILAPVLFPLPVEYAFILGLIGFVRLMDVQRLDVGAIAGDLGRYWAPLFAVAIASVLSVQYAYHDAMPVICAAVVVAALLLMARSRICYAIAAMILLAANPGFPWGLFHSVLKLERNFYGVAMVQNSHAGQMRLFMEGTTMHGSQPLVSPFQMLPMGYYHPQGPVGAMFSVMDWRGMPQRVAALGLGVGSIACYTRPGRSFDFYEIDPIVPKVAQDPKLFTYLSDCGSPYKIIMGDGRLKLQAAPDHSYDIIFLDAFSSDNIPIHLLTTQAFALYRQKLKPGGIIVADISNRYMDLMPVIQAAGDALHMNVMFKGSPTIHVREPDIYAYASIYAVFIPDGKGIAEFANAGFGLYNGRKVRAWTDDYANPLSVMWFMKPSLPKNELTLNQHRPH